MGQMVNETSLVWTFVTLLLNPAISYGLDAENGTANASATVTLNKTETNLKYGAVTPSALLQIASLNTNDSLWELLSGKSKLPRGLKVFDTVLCTSYDTSKNQCLYNDLMLFATKSHWPYFATEKAASQFPMCGLGHGDSGCDSFKYLTSSCGKILFNKTEPVAKHVYFEKGEALECQWIIEVKKNRRILLTFEYMNLKYCGDTCLCDSLDIYDYKSGGRSGHKLRNKRYSFCGTRQNWSITSLFNTVVVKFKLSGYSQGTGFKIKYRKVKSDLVLSLPHAVTRDKGRIGIPAYTPNKIVNKQRIYEWQVRVEEGQRIKFTWQLNATCPSETVLAVYDGPLNKDQMLFILPTNSETNGTNVSASFQMSLKLSCSKSCPVTSLDIKYGLQEFGDIAAMNADEIRLSPNDSKFVSLSVKNASHSTFRAFIFKVQAGSYLSLNVTTFQFKGAGINNCEDEGFVIWDGRRNRKNKYGPFCGNEYHTMFFSIAYRNSSGNKENMNYPLIHTSSNKLILFFYKYSSPAETSFAFNVTVSECLGVFDWTKMHESLNADRPIRYSKTRMSVTVRPGRKCIQLQSLPSNKPCDVWYRVKFRYSKTPIMSKHRVVILPYIYGCKFSVETFSPTGLENAVWVEIECTCDLTAFGYTARCAPLTKNPDQCDVEEFPEKSKEVVLMNTFCGKIHPIKPQTAVVRLIAPFNKQENHYYSLTFKCANAKACLETGSKISLKENRRRSVKNSTNIELHLGTMSFRYDTAWSTYVDITIVQTKEYVDSTLELQYSLEESMEPGLHSVKGERFFFDNSSYVYIEKKERKPKTWIEADNKCRKNGGSLVTINSEDEFTFIKGLMRSNWMSSLRCIVYIGLHTVDKGHTWNDQSPATITDWYRSLYTGYQSLPSDFFGSNINFASTTLKQPTNDASCNCTAMAVLTPSMSTNWLRIPCQFPYPKSAFICEYPETEPDDRSPSSSGPSKQMKTFTKHKKKVTRLTPGTTDCPIGWTYRRSKCYKMITSTGQIDTGVSCLNATKMCEEVNGTMTFTKERSLRHLLNIWLFHPEYGSIWVGNCSKITVEDTGHKWISSSPVLEGTIPSAINVICESSSLQVHHVCLQNQVKCNDGTCILAIHQCDGVEDCSKGEDEQNCTCGADMLRCENGQCVPFSKYCDFQQDCDDNSDERNCTFASCPKNYRMCDNGQCLPVHMFGDHVADCMDFSDEKESDLLRSNCKSFLCYTGQCIPDSFVNNIRIDCVGQQQEDEVIHLKEIKRGKWFGPDGKLVTNNTSFCPSQTLTRCRLDHVLCFERHMACIYDEDKYGFMASCPDGEHLRQCKSYECPNMFKCPESYCIPYHKVCDGKRDCVDGYDEKSCKNLSCPGLFKCRNEGTCLDQSLVCDGIKHCKTSGDDEAVCSYRKCPIGCECTDRVLRCLEINADILANIPLDSRSLTFTGTINQREMLPFQNLIYLGKLQLRGIGIRKIKKGLFRHLQNLLLLDLRDNLLTSLERKVFSGLKNLQHLLLSGNSILHLTMGAFKGLSTLSYLKLDDLGIHAIEDGAFAGCSSVTDVSLAQNSISKMSPLTWRGLSNLKTLNLTGNRIIEIALGTFENMSLKELHTDHFKICCFATQVRICTSGGDVFPSCEDLIANKTLQIVIWIVGVVALVGNLGVIFGRFVSQDKRVISLMIVNFSMADLLMGTYLLIIASADTRYRGFYFLHSDQWRSSGLCKLAGLLSTLSFEMSVFILVLITVDRLFALVFPFQSKEIPLTAVRIIMAGGWVVCSVLSALPLSNLSYFGDSPRDGICLLFSITRGKTQGWEYGTYLFLLFNSIAFLFILVSYITMYLLYIFTSKKSDQDESSDKGEVDFEWAKGFDIIVVINVICRVPLMVTASLSLEGGTIDPVVSTWMTLLVMPLTSALNPCLYTINLLHQLRKQKEKKKKTYHVSNSVRVKETPAVCSIEEMPDATN